MYLLFLKELLKYLRESVLISHLVDINGYNPHKLKHCLDFLECEGVPRAGGGGWGGRAGSCHPGTACRTEGPHCWGSGNFCDFTRTLSLIIRCQTYHKDSKAKVTTLFLPLPYPLLTPRRISFSQSGQARGITVRTACCSATADTCEGALRHRSKQHCVLHAGRPLQRSSHNETGTSFLRWNPHVTAFDIQTRATGSFSPAIDD